MCKPAGLHCWYVNIYIYSVEEVERKIFMKKEEIKAKNAPRAIGPYSQAVRFGNLIFVSGQIGVDPDNNMLVEGIRNQTNQALTNLKNVLKAGDSDMNNIIKTTVYLADMDDFSVMNEIYTTYFPKPYPARATVQVARLPKDALVEIDCIAYINAHCCQQDSCCIC